MIDFFGGAPCESQAPQRQIEGTRNGSCKSHAVVSKRSRATTGATIWRPILCVLWYGPLRTVRLVVTDETPARYATTISQEPGHLEERLFAWRDQDGHVFRTYLQREQGPFKFHRDLSEVPKLACFFY